MKRTSFGFLPNTNTSDLFLQLIHAALSPQSYKNFYYKINNSIYLFQIRIADQIIYMANLA